MHKVDYFEYGLPVAWEPAVVVGPQDNWGGDLLEQEEGVYDDALLEEVPGVHHPLTGGYLKDIEGYWMIFDGKVFEFVIHW